jgi:hypothetical protein
MEVSPTGLALSRVDQRRLQQLEGRLSGITSSPTDGLNAYQSKLTLDASAYYEPEIDIGVRIIAPVLDSEPSGAEQTLVISTSIQPRVDFETKEETSSESSSPEKEKENRRKRPFDVLDIDERSNSRASNGDELQDSGSRGIPSKQINTLDKYFRSFGPNATSSSSIATGPTPSSSVAPPVVISSPPREQQSRASLAPINKNSKDKDILLAQYSEFKKEIESLRIAKELAESKVARLEDEVGRVQLIEERNLHLSKCLEEIYRNNARQEMRRKRDRLALDCVRLGKFRTVAAGPASTMETWEEGYALKELTHRSLELLQFKEELDKRRRKLQSQKRIAKKEDAGEFDHDHDLATEAEALRAHGEQQKKDEQSLADERRLLESEKEVHKKELRRCDCEDRSRFAKDLPCLNGRYILTSILGRGGFSEVWKAFDLVERRDVAIKIHHLNPLWLEERKQSYIKHVTREYTIHRDMQHPRIVQLFDVFEIDMNSFATIMELCKYMHSLLQLMFYR